MSVTPFVTVRFHRRSCERRKKCSNEPVGSEPQKAVTVKYNGRHLCFRISGMLHPYMCACMDVYIHHDPIPYVCILLYYLLRFNYVFLCLICILMFYSHMNISLYTYTLSLISMLFYVLFAYYYVTLI
jgi:hypothetical protein